MSDDEKKTEQRRLFMVIRFMKDLHRIGIVDKLGLSSAVPLKPRNPEAAVQKTADLLIQMLPLLRYVLVNFKESNQLFKDAMAESAVGAAAAGAGAGAAASESVAGDSVYELDQIRSMCWIMLNNILCNHMCHRFAGKHFRPIIAFLKQQLQQQHLRPGSSSASAIDETMILQAMNLVSSAVCNLLQPAETVKFMVDSGVVEVLNSFFELPSSSAAAPSSVAPSTSSVSDTKMCLIIDAWTGIASHARNRLIECGAGGKVLDYLSLPSSTAFTDVLYSCLGFLEKMTVDDAPLALAGDLLDKGLIHVMFSLLQTHQGGAMPWTVLTNFLKIFSQAHATSANDQELEDKCKTLLNDCGALEVLPPLCQAFDPMTRYQANVLSRVLEKDFGFVSDNAGHNQLPQSYGMFTLVHQDGFNSPFTR